MKDNGDDLFKWKGMHRIPDHDTSIEAAKQVEPKRSVLQLQVIKAFYELGPMTDEQLEDLERFSGYTYSTVRKRRTELYQQGVLVKVGTTLNSHGSRMIIWDLREDLRKNI